MMVETATAKTQVRAQEEDEQDLRKPKPKASILIDENEEISDTERESARLVERETFKAFLERESNV